MTKACSHCSILGRWAWAVLSSFPFAFRLGFVVEEKRYLGVGNQCSEQQSFAGPSFSCLDCFMSSELGISMSSLPSAMSVMSTLHDTLLMPQSVGFISGLRAITLHLSRLQNTIGLLMPSVLFDLCGCISGLRCYPSLSQTLRSTVPNT